MSKKNVDESKKNAGESFGEELFIETLGEVSGGAVSTDPQADSEIVTSGMGMLFQEGVN